MIEGEYTDKDKCGRVQIQEITPNIYGQLIINKCVNTIQWGKIYPVLHTHMQRNKVGLPDLHIHKI